MKKVLSVVLVFVMCFFLGGCGSKFETEDAMWKYLNGVWEGEWEGEYFLFIDKKFININNTQIENVINDYFKEFIERNGYEAFENLTVEEASSAVCKEIVKLKDDYSVDFKTGVIKFAGVDECTIKIDKKFEDTILVSNEDYKEKQRLKLSDEFDLNYEEFSEIFYKEKKDYKLNVKSFVSSSKEYVEKLKQNHKEINSYVLINDDENGKQYTDTGSAINFYDFLSYDDTMVVFTKKFGNNRTYNLVFTKDNGTPGVVANAPSNTISLDVMLKDSLAFIEDYPLVLSISDLIKMFDEEAEIKNGKRIFEKRIDEIRYTIVTSVESNAVIISTDE